MPVALTEQDTAERREKVLEAARWCFLNFGFAKTSLEDIAKRAGISRTLLYRTFKDKEDIFTSVFAHWLVARHPEARKAARAKGDPRERLMTICKVMVLEPWADMARAPMGSEFFDVCARIDPEIDALHRKVALECMAAVLGRAADAEVFLLALDGLLSDEPEVEVLDGRLGILVDRFVSSKGGRR
ncbi:MAG: TetR/AcrR family transcriptional regulator [Anaeromyxobacteraceae bacterium]